MIASACSTCHRRVGYAGVATSRKKEVQTGENAQLACTVRESFRQLKSTLAICANLIAVPPGEHRRRRQSFLEESSPVWTHG